MNSSSTRQNKFQKFNFISYMVFLVWPLMGLIYAGFNYRLRHSKNIIMLFCGFYGYNFVIDGKGGDVERYRDQLLSLHDAQYTVGEFIFMLINGTYGRGDFIQPIITYFVASFTDNYRILYLIYGLIFGYLFSRTIALLIAHTKDDFNYLIKLLLIFFAFIVPVWYINGVRYFLGMHFFVHGTLIIYLLKEKRGWYFLVASVLMHFAFLVPLALFFAHYLLPKKISIYLLLLLSSIFFVKMTIPEIVSYVPSTSTQLDARVKAYTHEQVIELVAKNEKNVAWFIKGHELFLQALAYIMMTFFIMYRKKIKNQTVVLFITFGILIFAFGNIVDKIPSMGRIYTLAHMLLTIGFILMLYDIKSKLLNRVVFTTMAIPSIFCILVSFRYSFDSMGLYTLLLNPLISPFFELTSNIRDLY